MQYEVQGHEVLAVEEVVTPTQKAILKTHHTMFAHVEVQAPASAAVGQAVTASIQLVRWDDRQPITDEERDLVVLVDGQEVERLTTVKGAAAVTLQFEAAGTYVIEVTGEKVTGASVEVTVA